MAKPFVDYRDPNAFAIVRSVIFQRLREEPNWTKISWTTGFENFMDWNRENADVQHRIHDLIVDAIWACHRQGITAPGPSGHGILNWDDFHLTDYGKKVIAAGEYIPNDPENYLRRMKVRVPTLDATAEAYIVEALDGFNQGLFVSATIMVGIAAERVLDLLCDALLQSLQDADEAKEFGILCNQNAVKPRLDWLNRKLNDLPKAMKKALPDDCELSISNIANMLRKQRNENGHPRETPPREEGDDVRGYLHSFMGLASAAAKITDYLRQNKI